MRDESGLVGWRGRCGSVRRNGGCLYRCQVFVIGIWKLEDKDRMHNEQGCGTTFDKSELQVFVGRSRSTMRWKHEMEQ